MTKPTSNLTDVFLEDQQQLTRGLARLRQALQQGDVSGAVRLADELDRQVGAHMQFEEDVFYPMLAERLGQEFTAQLYAEHAIGRETLLRIKELPSKQIDVELRKELIASLSETLDHALSCGSMPSHVARLDADRQAGLLNILGELSSKGRRWTDLVEPGSETQT